ncbi:MAG: Rieske (2Fe-2S) protein [Pseudomonadota bacterium]|nr:Rieske (2Fe-2S) protein [Pseudomonadota bacterium]
MAESSKEPAERLIGALTDMADGAAKGFDLEVLGKRRLLFGVRQGGEVRIFQNSCPHLGTPLNIMPNRFLTSDGKLINCSTHGALFNKEDGLCIAGPCKGQFLRRIPASVRDGGIYIQTRYCVI